VIARADAATHLGRLLAFAVEGSMTKTFPATRAGRILAVSLLSALALGAMLAVATRAASPL
jgi:hypothetical protein